MISGQKDYMAEKTHYVRLPVRNAAALVSFENMGGKWGRNAKPAPLKGPSRPSQNPI